MKILKLQTKKEFSKKMLRDIYKTPKEKEQWKKLNKNQKLKLINQNYKFYILSNKLIADEKIE